MAKDYYQILGITKSASADDISKAFKKLARKYHPDVNPGDKKAEDKFKALSEAYQVLSDKEKRKKYDMYGSADFEGAPGGGGGFRYQGGGNPFGGGFTGQVNQDDLGDIFSDIFGAGGFGLGNNPRSRKKRGFSGAEQMVPQRGKDFTFSIDLDFEDAVKGCEKKVRLSNGATFNVKIPAGVVDGNKIRLAGKGEPGLHGGEPGDLFIEPHVRAHNYFVRNGDDIEVHVPITITEAIEGGRLRVPTVDGMVDLKIAEGVKSGQKMRLKGKGAPNMKTKERGDQYVILEVVLPQNIDSKTKLDLLKLLKDKEEDPRKKLW